jgi:hypothetical protein
MSRDNADPRVRVIFIALVTACGVIAVLTIAAFWLSYAHLHAVAAEHGLGGVTASVKARAWAWPATLDLFIVAGEVLMFVDSLKGRRGVWAIGLTVAGSLGSIGLNVSGVGLHAPALDYVVAGVPPTAALLAFGALMHQVREFIVSLSPVPEQGQDDVPTVPGDMSPEPVVPTAVSPAPVVPVSPVPRDKGQDVVPAAVSPEPAVSRPRAAVPAAVSPSRPGVRITLDKTAEEIRAGRDMSGDKGQAKVDVPEDKLGNLSAIVRFLMETGHSKDEIRAIVPTLPGHDGVKPDSLKKAIQRAEKALAVED